MILSLEVVLQNSRTLGASISIEKVMNVALNKPKA